MLLHKCYYKLYGIPFEFGFVQAESNGGGCISCIFDVVAQAAADLMIFNIVPWTLSKKVFEDAIKPHKFNTASASFMNADDVPPGSVSILKRTSNGFGHAVDKYGLDELFASTEYPFGGIILNGTGSYELNVGKNAMMTSELNGWKFGPSAKLETGWTHPSESLNPLDAIIGESPFPLVPGRICEPSIKKYERILANEYDGYTFGQYKGTYKGFDSAGVYTLPLFKLGWFGLDETSYLTKIPNWYSDIKGFKLKLSSIGFSINSDVYKIDPIKYSLYLNDPNKYSSVSVVNDVDIPTPMKFKSPMMRFAAPASNNSSTSIIGINSIEIPEDGNSFRFELGEGDFKISAFGRAKFVKLREQLPNTAAAISLAVPIASLLAKLIPRCWRCCYTSCKSYTRYACA